MTTITLEHIRKQFEQMTGAGEARHVQAIENVSLKIASGSVLGIVGPSGCGKSTLLRIIAGLTQPDSGEVLYDNVPLRDIPLQERGVGMVFQNGPLMPHWETRKTVGFFLWLRKRDYEVPERVARISSITGVGLDQLLDRRPSQLSGGEQQRVAVARALTRDPRVFLFDEPFSNLDAKLRAEARVELKRLLGEFPVTSVYVTHDQVEAVALAHRIAVMREGQIEQVGTYRQLYSNPVNRFVAEFIGTPHTNFFEGHVEGGAWRGENFGPYPIRHDLEDGTRVTLGIRPDSMSLIPDGVPCVVDEITPFYAERYQLLDVHLGRERWSISLPPDTPVSVGATVYCTLDPANALYFDAESGKRIG